MNQIVKAVKTSTLAVWSMILGILSLLCFGLFTGIPAVICGHMAHSKIKRSAGSIQGEGMAIAGLITGYIGTVFATIAIIGILAAIAIPQFLAYRDRAACSIVESEARCAAVAVEDYLSDPEQNDIPTLLDLAGATGYKPRDEISVEISGTIDDIVIVAVDRMNRCHKGGSFVLSIPADMNDGWQ